MTKNGRSVYDDTTLFEFYSLKPSRSLLDNILNRENFKAAFDHFDYKKIRNILMIKFKIYYKMLVSYATNSKFIRLPTHKISSQFKKNFSFHTFGFVNHTPVNNSQET
jgi:DNA-3-methyladenine glycosylase I